MNPFYKEWFKKAEEDIETIEILMEKLIKKPNFKY
jgi:hypothetical protein